MSRDASDSVATVVRPTTMRPPHYGGAYGQRRDKTEALLDESQAGPLLATINLLRADKVNLIHRNQALQMAAATQTQDEISKAQAATIAAEDRAADAEQQLNTANERIAQLTVRGTELEDQNQHLQSQPQAQADLALQQSLTAFEGQVRELHSQILTLNQQLPSLCWEWRHAGYVCPTPSCSSCQSAGTDGRPGAACTPAGPHSHHGRSGVWGTHNLSNHPKLRQHG